MCGIFAAIAPKGHPACHFAPHAVELLRHRGPDAQGTLHVVLPWASVTLGMSRLKVVDQTDIPVPFSFDTGPAHGLRVCANGEIYNWRELRRELGSPGEWTTECDIEVLAAAWRAWGPACLDKLNGMFAFVLVDTVKNEVFAVRDRAGEKPLYWSRRAPRSDVTYFASETKALPTALQECSCPEMDVLEFDCGYHTPLKGVYAVEPGTYCKIQPALTMTPRPWWRLPQEPSVGPAAVRDAERLVEEVEATLVDAVKIRHVAERKVAIQLSGGLDSALIQAVAACENPYCVTFPELDNLSSARQAAASMSTPASKRPAVVPVTFTRDELLAALPEVAYFLDTPATWTAVCQWFLNRKIAEDGGVVVLSGEGADELFGGYARYRVLHHLDEILSDLHLGTYGPLIQRTLDGPLERYVANMLNRGGAEAHNGAVYLVAKHGGTGSLVDRMARTDFYTTMQVLVRMADRMSAAFGLENRSPFFDYRLVELAMRIPSSVKATHEASKVPLRSAASRLGVATEIVHERAKRGLTIPTSWGDGQWNRTWFATEMFAAWRVRCLRPALCRECVCKT
jgi:asparagine synthase (glutamine-hydrolysing)